MDPNWRRLPPEQDRKLFYLFFGLVKYKPKTEMKASGKNVNMVSKSFETGIAFFKVRPNFAVGQKRPNPVIQVFLGGRGGSNSSSDLTLINSLTAHINSVASKPASRLQEVL